MSLVAGKDCFASVLAVRSILSLTLNHLHVLLMSIGQVVHIMVEKQCGIEGLLDIEPNETFGFRSLL